MKKSQQEYLKTGRPNLNVIKFWILKFKGALEGSEVDFYFYVASERRKWQLPGTFFGINI